MLPIAILIGFTCYKWLHVLIPIVPVFIFFVLLFAYGAMDLDRLKITKLNIILLVLHLLIAIVAYTICYVTFKPIVAQSILVGVVCPVAAASSAVVANLGGSREIGIVHTILDNFLICIIAPIMFAMAESTAELTFMQSVLMLLGKITPVVAFPLLAALLVRRIIPKSKSMFKQYEWMSILFWACAIMINMAATAYSIFTRGHAFMGEIISMLILALVMCCIQFTLGKWIGGKFGETIVGAQGIGQKNTALGIWMAYTYFSNPLTTIYAATYSVYQNLYNSMQMYFYDKKKIKNTFNK